MKIDDKTQVTDEGLREFGQCGTIISINSGIEHILVSVSLSQGGQRVFKACSLSMGKCRCRSGIQAPVASTGKSTGMM